MTNDNDASGALTEIAKAAWDEAWRLAFDDGLSAGHPLGRSRLDRETEWADSEVVARIAKLPAGDGLTDEQLDKFVADLVEYGTEFVAPLYAVVEQIERTALAAPRQPGEMGAGVPDYMNMQHVGVFCNVNSYSERPRWEQMQEGYNGDGAVHLYRRKPTNVDLSPEWCLAAVQREMATSAQQDERRTVKFPDAEGNEVSAYLTFDELAQRFRNAADELMELRPGKAAQQDEREAFEAWLQPYWSRDKYTDPEGDVVYREAWVQGAWIAWQARAQQVQADAGAVAYIPDDALARLTPPLLVLDGVRLYRYNGIGTTALYLRPAAESDKTLLDWLTEQLVDTIYLDDGRIIDVGTGRIGERDLHVSPHDVRAAIRAAMSRDTEDSNG